MQQILVRIVETIYQVAAISVGLVNQVPLLDLDYNEDSQADVDLNIVMTSAGALLEIQGTAERHPFTRKQLNQLLDLAENGLVDLLKSQKEVLQK